MAAARLRNDVFAQALYAAELGEPFELSGRARNQVLSELFSSLAQLRDSVACATLRLLVRVANDDRAEVRESVARALSWFTDVFPEECEALALTLASDEARSVREAAQRALGRVETYENVPMPHFARAHY